MGLFEVLSIVGVLSTVDDGRRAPQFGEADKRIKTGPNNALLWTGTAAKHLLDT